MIFWDRLYFGLGAEYFVTGELFIAGYEAFKLPADFGLDLIVTSQKQLSFSQPETELAVPPPYVLQVKARRISEFDESSMGRPEAFVDIFVKREDWELIIKDDHAYLVGVLIFRENPNQLQNRWTYFWLHSSHLSELDAKGYVDQNRDGKYVLTAVLRLRPRAALDTALDDLVDEDELTESGREKLLKTFAQALPTSWDTREYISLARPGKREPDYWVVSILPYKLTSFYYLGEHVKLRLK
jgi:hypothetical protein